MKKIKNLFKNFLIILIVITILASFTNSIAYAKEKVYVGLDKNLTQIYSLKWYENPTRQVLKCEFMLVQLRVIQASLQRRGLLELKAKDNEILNFKDKNTLSSDIQEEAKILKSLGVLIAASDGYIKIKDSIKRFEAAKILTIINKKVLNIPSIKNYIPYSDVKSSESKYINIAYQINLLNGITSKKFNPNGYITLEETLKILENEVGYYGILREDIAKAMSQTFKVSLNTDVSNSKITSDSYLKYEEKMKTYGFAKLYNNESVKSSETVTKAEALKIALAVTFNTDDISGFAQEYDEYENQTWVEYAKAASITSEDITVLNYNKKARYIDVISYFENCKTKILKKKSVKPADIYLKDISSYSNEEQYAMKDMVTDNIIYLMADTLNGNDYIYKGELNEIVVNFVERYSTISNGKINTDPENMPANAYLYPYILTDVDKSVYEMPLISEYNTDFLNAKQLYDYKKYDYPQIDTYCKEFFDVLLNVDYRTITEESFKESISNYTTYKPNNSQIKKYVEYVKKNKIITEGTAKLQFPIFYFDGISYRIRIKITYEIKSSKTNKNLIYLDYKNGLEKTYNKDKYEFVVDYYMTNAIGSDYIYIQDLDLYESIINKKTCGITQEKDE